MSISKSLPRNLPEASLFRDAEKILPHLRKLSLKWFHKQARELPWRVSPTHLDALHQSGVRLRRSPYATWIAEIMLQQTQVATVIPYYEKWMKRFPTSASLAGAPEADVLRHWAGLGYYARARNLQAAVKLIVEHGRYPDSIDGWLALPGIGPYTAGAIASLAFDRPEPILDGNVIRVFSRVLGLGFLPGDGVRQREAYWKLAGVWAAEKKAGDANESLMELGALICTPSSPDCASCPLSSDCQAFKRGWQKVLPPSKKRAPIETVTGVAVIGRRRGKILMGLRSKGGFLAGHEMFPLFPGPGSDIWRKEFSIRFGKTKIENVVDAGEVRHSIMNKRYVFKVLNCRIASEKKNALNSNSDVKWISENEVENCLTNSLARKIWKASESRTGQAAAAKPDRRV